MLHTFFMIKKPLLLFLLLQVAFTSLYASKIDFTKESQEILSSSTFYVDTQNRSFEQIRTKPFSPTNSSHINLGFIRDTTLWIRLDFYNEQSRELSRILEVQNPLLESATLYSSTKLLEEKTLCTHSEKKTLNTSFEITLKPYELKTVYIELKNSTTALRVGLYLKERERLFRDEHLRQAKIFFFFGILFILFAYTTTLYIYTKEKSYMFYAAYLLSLIAQQSTYLGVSQMFLPVWLMYYDNLAVVLKVNIFYITAALFAKSFLQTRKYPLLDKIYNSIIIIALIEIPIVGFPGFYYPEVAILTGFIFILFNMFVGVYVYIDGYKQARFFVVGWSFLVVGFTLMILDGLGLISFMHKVPNLIMYLTAVEAILLSLAFIDKYIILKEQKERGDELLLEELRQRQNVIETEIQKQTKHLNSALENEQIILRELQHRTKNNLQLILSLTRMQADSASEEGKGYLKNLESRINAIAKTHEMLYLKDDVRYISMNEYIEELCSDLEHLSKKELVFQIEARQIFMPIKEASYLGLILNELITNSIKYVKLSNIIFSIEVFKVDSSYRFEVKDNGQCYDYQNTSRDSLGLKLVNTLVKDQLDGEISVERKNGCIHIIKFQL